VATARSGDHRSRARSRRQHEDGAADRERALADYPKFFAGKVLNDRDSVMHNADLIPPQFDAPVAITWRRSDKPLTARNAWCRAARPTP
jgi:hypothetical protein